MLGATRTSSISGYIKQQGKRHKPLTSLAYQGKPVVIVSESRMVTTCVSRSSVGRFRDNMNARRLGRGAFHDMSSAPVTRTHDLIVYESVVQKMRRGPVQPRIRRLVVAEEVDHVFNACCLIGRLSTWKHVEGDHPRGDGLHSVGPRAVLMAEGMAWQNHVSGVRW